MRQDEKLALLQQTVDQQTGVIEQLRNEVSRQRYELTLREKHLTKAMGKDYLGALLGEVWLELRKAIEYRKWDTVCEGEGPDDDPAAIETGCPECRSRARKEVAMLGGTLFSLEAVIEQLEGNLGKEMFARDWEVPEYGTDERDDFREECEEAWDRVMAGSDPYYLRWAREKGESTEIANCPE